MTAATPAEDPAIRVTAALAGDLEARTWLVQRSYRLIRGTVRRQLSELRCDGVPICDDSEEDAIQHVYVCLLDGVLAKWRKGSIWGFIRAVARFRAMDFFTRRGTAWFGWAVEPDDSGDAREPISPAPDPEQAAALAELLPLCSEHLTDRELTILTLWVDNDLDPSDIAQILRVSPANISATLYRIRQKLAAEFVLPSAAQEMGR